MKTKSIVDLLVPIHKIHKECAIHYVGLKNAAKKVVFSNVYNSVASLLKHVIWTVKVDKKYAKYAIADYHMLKTHLDISHEVKAITDGMFAQLLPSLADIDKLLQSFTDED